MRVASGREPPGRACLAVPIPVFFRNRKANMKPLETQVPLVVGAAFLLSAIAIELYRLLVLNDGMFAYTLDDAYIHLALAENIIDGHYGINSGEYSSPASSILWPLIIAPVARWEWFPFVLNVVFAVATVFFVVKVLRASFSMADERKGTAVVAVATIAVILATNLIGLPFTGMEHSLQLLLVAMIVYGLVVEAEGGAAPVWLLIAIIAAPLVRYECLAISGAALLYLAVRRHPGQAVIGALLLAAFLGGFSVFLVSLGLDPLPSSVSVKSSVVESGGRLTSFVTNLLNSLLSERQGIIMSFAALALALYALLARDTTRRQLAAVAVLAVSMHLVAGRYGWYNRYEVYIWLFLLLMGFYISGSAIQAVLERKGAGVVGIVALVAVPVVLAGLPYIKSLYNLPVAANNIYEQQYQMHRFAVDYYDQPIAANDIGDVSYQNSNYVLDLWGLASGKALELRRRRAGSAWLREICEEHQIGLVMIYQDWFKDIPRNWTKVGTLHLGKQKITPASSDVSFYATGPDSLPGIVEKLRAFVKTLPPGVTFDFADHPS